MKRIGFIWFCIFLSISLFGQQTVFDFSRQAIANRIKSDIYALASDSFMGRESGTAGEILARDYIISKFREAGISPYFGDTTYIQELYVWQTFTCNPYNNQLKIDDKIYSYESEFLPIIYSANDSITGELCFVNYGISAPSLNYDDYRDLTDLKDKIFVIELSIPGGYGKKSVFMPYSLLSYKIDLAIKKGAKGIIFINSDNKYPYEPVKLVSGFSRFKIPVIYFYKNKNELFQTTITNPKVIIKTEIISDNSGKAYNVAGYINNNALYTVIIGGHYDHVGYGGDGSLSNGTNEIHNGADDNASGTAGVIELGRYLKNSGCKKYNYLFIAFSAEEKGLYGSKYFVKSNSFNKEKINYMINLDMIGRLDSISNIVEVWAAGSSRQWKTELQKPRSNQLKFKILKGTLGDSDHHTFYKKHIPTLFFITGLHPDYHRPADKANKINYTGETEILLFLESLINDLETQDKVKFKKTGIFANLKAIIYTLSEMTAYSSQ